MLREIQWESEPSGHWVFFQASGYWSNWRVSQVEIKNEKCWRASGNSACTLRDLTDTNNFNTLHSLLTFPSPSTWKTAISWGLQPLPGQSLYCHLRAEELLKIHITCCNAFSRISQMQVDYAQIGSLQASLLSARCPYLSWRNPPTICKPTMSNRSQEISLHDVRTIQSTLKIKISHAAQQFSQHLILGCLVQYLPSGCFKFTWFICFQFLSCFALLRNKTEQDWSVSVPDVDPVQRRSLSAFWPSRCKRPGEGSCFRLVLDWRGLPASGTWAGCSCWMWQEWRPSDWQKRAYFYVILPDSHSRDKTAVPQANALSRCCSWAVAPWPQGPPFRCSPRGRKAPGLWPTTTIWIWWK